MTNNKPQCHYEILSVARDADQPTIKKAHRKLALKWHPDKHHSNEETYEEATLKFRLIQQAYECLSDPQEREWYDEHREMILRGHRDGIDPSGNGGGDGEDGEAGSSFLYDVIPFQYAGCYNGYTNDTDDNFYSVYQDAFDHVMEGEKNGWVSEGNIENMPLSHFPSDFGDEDSDYASVVSGFYNSWESFSSCLSFAWADKYDVRDAPSRRVRRGMEDENRKSRRLAKKSRNEDMLSFVRFVKRRDPRVGAQRDKVEREKKEREESNKKAQLKKKEENLKAREAWRRENEKKMMEEEANDLNLGRVRLADLDDDDDYYYGGKKGKKKGKKGKKQRWRDDDDDDDNNDDTNQQDQAAEPVEDITMTNADNENTDQPADQEEDNNNDNVDGAQTVTPKNDNDDDKLNPETNKNDDTAQTVTPENAPSATLTSPDDADTCTIAIDQEHTPSDSDSDDDSESSESSEEEEPEYWRCECCNKTFQSENQYNNHMKSKKHKEAWKKYEKKLKKMRQKEKAAEAEREEDLMESFIDELDDEDESDYSEDS